MVNPNSKMPAKRQLNLEDIDIAKMTFYQIFVKYYLSDRVLRIVNVIMQQFDFILNFSGIFSQFKSDDFMEVVEKVLKMKNETLTTLNNSDFKVAFYDLEKEAKKSDKKICNIISIVINCLSIFRIIAVMTKDRKALVNGRIFLELLLVLGNIVLKTVELFQDSQWYTQLCLIATGFKLMIAMYDLNQGQVRKLKTRVIALEKNTKKHIFNISQNF